MRFTKTQKEILISTTATRKDTASDIGAWVGIPAGPAARSAQSLANKGFLKQTTNKEGETVYSRTAEGGKAAKKFN